MSITKHPMSHCDVQSIPLAQIATVAQVRTSSGLDTRSLRELAESLTEHGMLQPVLLRPAAVDDAATKPYVAIAGHRRLAAAALAGFDAVPAIILALDAGHAATTQMVENIQRAQLTLSETAAGVRALAELHGNAAALCPILHKSKSWVSKHLALTSPRFNSDVRALMDDGTTEDLELLHSLNQLAHKAPDPQTLPGALRKVRAGKLGREGARQLLAQLGDEQPDPDYDPRAARGAASEDDAEQGAPTGGRQSVTVTLSADQAAKFEALGGVRWLRKQLRAARVLDA